MEKKTAKDFLSLVFKKGMVYVLLLLIIIISSIASPVFFTAVNAINVLKQVAIYAIISFPITCLIICGMTDLSAGSDTMFAGLMGIHVYVNTIETWNPVLAFAAAILAALISGAIVGFINGMVVTRLHVPAFMATLASMEMFRGGGLLSTNGQIIYNIGDIGALGSKVILMNENGVGLPISVLIMLACFVVFHFMLTKTVYGRSLYAIGGNEEAARASGINVENVRLRAFITQGVCCGIAGIILMGRLNSGQPTAADGYEFDAIIGAIMGGTSFSGGQGTIIGSIVGILIVGIINNILQLCGVQSYYHQILKGLIIVVAVSIDMRGKFSKAKKKA